MFLFPCIDSLSCIIFSDSAYTVASFGLLGTVLGLVQLVVLGVDNVEHNVVVESTPYFVGTGTA